MVSARRVSLSRKVPNADVAGRSMRSDSSFSSNGNRMFKVYDGQRVRYFQNSAVAGPDMYMYSRCMQGDPPPIYFNNDD
jgi:hypothetical protein